QGAGPGVTPCNQDGHCPAYCLVLPSHDSGRCGQDKTTAAYPPSGGTTKWPTSANVMKGRSEIPKPEGKMSELFGSDKGGASLEYPGFGKGVMLEDTSEYPAEDVVLLDDVWQEAECGGYSEDLAAVNHGPRPSPSASGPTSARP